MLALALLVGALVANAQDHVTLPDTVVQGKRVIVIGDVHGCYTEMMDLLSSENLLSPDQLSIAEDAVVIFAGDIINKGPLNIEVLRFVKNSAAYVVAGNHELNIQDNPSKYPWTSEITPEEWAWVESIPYTISIPLYNTRVVHAGLLPDTPPEENTVFVMTRMRNIEVLEDGTMIPHEETNDGVNWGTLYEGPVHVCYGHDAGRGRDEYGNPVIQWHAWATGLDSRCVSGGLLSGIYLPVSGSPAIAQAKCQEYLSFTTDLEWDD